MGERLPKGKSLPQSFYRPLILKAHWLKWAEKAERKRCWNEFLKWQSRIWDLKTASFLKTSGEFRWRRKANWERYLMVREVSFAPILHKAFGN
jgi:hypothetical protein